LVSTGLRLSEACRLHRNDVDLREGLLTVREGKFRKTRLVPLHPTAVQALTRYAARRDAFQGAPRSEFFFPTDRAPALTRAAVEHTFSSLRDRLDWTTHGRTGHPRIHDLRHTFAVRKLLRWYEEGADVNRKILALATYLGHAKVTDTYWYLSAVPELMAVTARRFELFAQPQRGGVS
jgi:integrase